MSVVRAVTAMAVVLFGLVSCDSGDKGGPRTESSPSPTDSSPSPTDPSPSPTTTELVDERILQTLEHDFHTSDLELGFGSVWLEDHSMGSDVYRMDPGSGEILKKFSLDRPCDIGIGLGGVWVSELEGSSLARIDPRTNKISARIKGLTEPCGSEVSGGAVWVGTADGVARVDPDLKKVVAVVRIGRVAALATGEGSVWAAPEGRALLHRIDPATNDVVAKVRIGDAQAPPQGGIPYVGLGSVWVAHGSEVSRIDPETNKVIAMISTGAGAGRISFGFGSAWVTNYEDGTVSQIDPGTNEVVATIETGPSPNGIGVGLGGVWVANTGNRTVVLVAPKMPKA